MGRLWMRGGLMHAMLVLVGVLFGSPSMAQTPLPLPNPDLELLTNGAVLAIVRLEDGSLVFGGTFSSVNGVARKNIAKIRSDATIDADWNPSANNTVTTLAVDSRGNIYAGGYFTKLGPRDQSYIAKIGITGAPDENWNPAPDFMIESLVIDEHDDLYAGGGFTTIGGRSRRGIAKLATEGTGLVDPLWDPSPNAGTKAIALDKTGWLYLGGRFTSIQGQNHRYLARVAVGGTGVVDSNWKPSPDYYVDTVALDEAGSVYVGGGFFNIGGGASYGLAKLTNSGSGAIDPVWRPQLDNRALHVVPDNLGSVYIAGSFTKVRGEPRSGVAKLAADGVGTPVSNWSPAATGGGVSALALSPSGVLYLGGGFNALGGQQHLGFGAVLANGSPIPTWADAEAPGYVLSIASQADGQVVIGGAFWKVGQLVRRNIFRLRPDLTLDHAWDPSADGTVSAVLPAPDGNVYVGGYFSTVGGAARKNIAKLAGFGAGAAIPAWNPGTDSNVHTFVLDENRNLYVGGSFWTIGGQQRSAIARLSGDGSVDSTWNPSANGGRRVLSLALDEAGQYLYVGGDFNVIGGQNRMGIAKLATSGTGRADASWDPSASQEVSSIVAGPDGYIYAGGAFTSIGGRNRNYIAKLSKDGVGAADPTWNPSAESFVYDLALDGSGRIYVGGGFKAIGGLERGSLARLSLFGVGAVDPIWNPSAVGFVHALALGADGVVFAGGQFTEMGGAKRGGIAAIPEESTVTTIVSVTPATTVVGQPYTVKFGVSASSRVPPGAVAVDDGQGSSCGPVVLVNGAGSCALPSTQAGGFVLTATYTPDTGAFAPSSATAHHAVNRANTSVAITGHAPERSIPGQAVSVTAALAVVSPGAGVPTGPITVGDGVDSCSIPQGAKGCSLTLTSRGSRVLTATYPGDGNFDASSAEVTHAVNRLPLVPVPPPFVTNEDVSLTVPAPEGLLAQASDPDGDALTIANAGALTADGIGGTVALQADGSFVYTPPANTVGIATFGYTVGDGYETVTATASITVNLVNHAPNFSLAATPKWPAGSAGTKTQAGFATVTDFGAPNEANQQVLAWHVRTIADPDAVASNVAIALDGTLSYSLSGNAGRATFGVTLQDDGGTANGGVDTSEELTFTLSVAAGLDLSVRIHNDSDFVVGGAPVEYTIVVRNAGPDDAVGARVRDALPVNLVDAVWLCAPSAGAACTLAGSGDIDDTVNLPAGSALSYSLIATVVAEPEITVEHVVSVTAPDGVADLDPGNNSATRRNTVGVFFDGFDPGSDPGQ